MVDSQYKSVRNQLQDHLRVSERPLLVLNSSAETRRVSRESVRRLEDIIAVQEDRVRKMRHRSVGTPSQTLRLRASNKDLLLTYRLTLQQIRQIAETLELSCAILDE